LQSDIKDDKYYSAEEVSDLIGSLDTVALTKLYKIASNMGMIFRYDTKSLVHDAIVKLLEPEGRKWRKDYSIFTIFKKIFWSILYHYTEHFESEDSLNEPNQEGPEPIENIQREYLSPEQQLILVDIRKHIYSVFKDDPIATELIDSKLEGFKKGEILDLLDLSDKEYETAWKRIRRKMKRDYQGSMV